ncbi:hypothetical protein [Methanolapillus millepedarum]|uniref:hypothetical protein n=1 Tax=Methanolapillus millepedarum TaxID=3028296 RepID=UPI0030B875AF
MSLVPASVAEEVSLNESEYENISISQPDDPLPRLYPETDRSAFKNLEKADGVLKTSGEVPRKSEGADAQSWNEDLEKIVSGLQSDSEFEKYLSENGGLIDMFFVNYDYISIVLSGESKLTNQELDNIIQMITVAGEENGIRNIPIAVYGNSTNIESENEQQIPGFEFLVTGVVFAVLCVFLFRKKSL